MQVSEIMHKGIRSVNINESVKKVAELMRQEDIGALPVLENDKPIGFVTDRDIVISCVAEGYDTNGSIRHAMNEDVYTVQEDADIKEATQLMKDKQVSRILVVDSSQKPIGMISLQDLSGNISQSESANTLNEIKH